MNNKKVLSVLAAISILTMSAGNPVYALEETPVTSIEYITSDTFRDNWEVETVKLPDGIKSIGKEMFYNCENLNTIEIPASVENIDASAFMYCCALTDINVDPENKNYKSVDGVLFSSDMKELVRYPTGRTDMDYVVPDSVEKISENAFHSSQLLSLKLCDNVKEVDKGAFANSLSLISVSFGKNIESIGSDVFERCIQLSDVYYTGTKEQWDDIDNVTETFSNSDLQLHYGTELTDGVAVSGKYGELITWTLEKNVLKIEGTGEIKYNNNFPCYPWYYYDSYVRKVVISDGITAIGSSAFGGFKDMVSIDIPESVTSISFDAFSGCTSLKSVYIPSGVKQLDYGVFVECASLETIDVSEENESYKSIDGVWFTKDGKELLHYPEGKTDSTYTVPENVEAIKGHAFMSAKCSSIIIPDSVTYISSYAFAGSKITDITIPEGITEIYNGTFLDCPKLESVKLNGEIKSVGQLAFACCSSLKSVEFINTPENIEENSFWNSDLFKPVTVPGNVKTVDQVEETVYGDLNSDMTTDLTDLSLLSLHLLDDTSLDESALKAADVNGDGDVNLADLAHFKQYISKDDVTLGLQ